MAPIIQLAGPRAIRYEKSGVMARIDSSDQEGGQQFRTTHWSVVITAAHPDEQQSREAVAKLCQTYWYPLYAFIRRRGHGPEEASDLTQELFARLVEKNTFETADRDRGRFRSFLLGCAQNFLNNEHRRERTVKRGGRLSFVSIEDLPAEERYAAEPAELLSPDRLFERRWAMTLLDTTLSRLRQEFEASGKTEQFEALHEFLSGARAATTSYEGVARRLAMSEAAARQAAHRLRARFAELLRAGVAETVAEPGEIEAELAHLLAVLSA